MKYSWNTFHSILYAQYSVSALILFIIFIYFRNLQFLTSVILYKAKDLLPKVYVIFIDFGYPA